MLRNFCCILLMSLLTSVPAFSSPMCFDYFQTFDVFSLQVFSFTLPNEKIVLSVERTPRQFYVLSMEGQTLLKNLKQKGSSAFAPYKELIDESIYLTPMENENTQDAQLRNQLSDVAYLVRSLQKKTPIYETMQLVSHIKNVIETLNTRLTRLEDFAYQLESIYSQVQYLPMALNKVYNRVRSGNFKLIANLKMFLPYFKAQLTVAENFVNPEAAQLVPAKLLEEMTPSLVTVPITSTATSTANTSPRLNIGGQRDPRQLRYARAVVPVYPAMAPLPVPSPSPILPRVQTRPEVPVLPSAPLPPRSSHSSAGPKPLDAIAKTSRGIGNRTEVIIPKFPGTTKVESIRPHVIRKIVLTVKPSRIPNETAYQTTLEKFRVWARKNKLETAIYFSHSGKPADPVQVTLTTHATDTTFTEFLKAFPKEIKGVLTSP